MNKTQYILATFQNGKEVIFTDISFGLLTTDKDVLTIIDADTGELLYSKEESEQ